ncbi:hypothetical protein FRACA_1930013 [Frankia canadensis]|uniref:Uncharacterized protein n=1 Tax=Frankia canadensis TaxID=1836972 RepID=A0A2I2KPD9_9ACTN|nr:hypothetical protein FRACA_1930013 [Frankia canadensis]SOU54827.1 hypothetical protein FRACA_1930013 [Frankia canadensis]
MGHVLSDAPSDGVSPPGVSRPIRPDRTDPGTVAAPGRARLGPGTGTHRGGHGGENREGWPA